MFNLIRSFLSRAIQSLNSIFNLLFCSNSDLSDEQKENFILTIIRGQKLGSGYALRHVDSDKIIESNIKNGFRGDAVSYAITPYIMSLTLGEEVLKYSLYLPETGPATFLINDEVRPRNLDTALAVRLFDILHGKILQFVRQNFSGNPHHFMVIKDMQGAELPYDIKEIYPTGKCGKRWVDAKQIIKVVSKSNLLNSPEDVVQSIEKCILKQEQYAKHSYQTGSTKAIISVLREIELKPYEEKLTSEEVQMRLISAEYDRGWTSTKYDNFYGSEGYFKIFKQNLPKINDDLEYFRFLL